ncbi:MAG: aspartate-semialdehyde dehydrogenase [Desulfobacteraceae bacterium]|nr:aspartate-semialdehyde dehydrogenase [Desulfobacteraceae bacterium]
MVEKKLNVIVAGATGAVGAQMLTCLEEQSFPINNFKLLASSRSAGKKIKFRDETFVVEEMTKNSFKGYDIALFSAGGSTSLEFAPASAEAGCVVVDNSSAWRMDTDIPLVVPEVNPDAVAQYKNKGIIANPNCSTIQMVVALNPIYRNFGIKRLVISTYQAVSGSGVKAVNELREQVRAVMEGKSPVAKVYPHPIAFNALPHIDSFLDSGYSKEEMKMVNETRKILNDETIMITATAVRVPVFNSHSESVNIETKEHATCEQIRGVLNTAPGVKVLDDPQNNVYPLALDAHGNDLTFVGRIRQDLSIENGIDIWIVSDNIRKGAATNTVQIGRLLAEKYL